MTENDLPEKRGLTQQQAMTYVGAKRRTWEALWAPRLVAIKQGVYLIYDRHDLDRVFDQLKAEAASAVVPGQGPRTAEYPFPIRGTAGNVNDVVEAASLLHGQEIDAFGDAGYQGAAKRPDAKADVRWHIAMRPGKRAALKEDEPLDVLIDELERVKASIRAKVEHPFRVIKRQFGHVRVRYRGLKKITAQLFPLFALSNLWMVRGKLLAAQG